jgi:hypothetical protein
LVFHSSLSLLVRCVAAWGAVADGQRCGHPPDGSHCSRRAGLQQCKSFVEMCIVSCLSASSAYVCGLGLQPGAALIVVRLAIVTLPPRSTTPSVAGCRLVGCIVISRGPLRSRAVAGVFQCFSVGLGPVLQCPVPACDSHGRLTGAGSGSHYGVEFGRSRTGLGLVGVFGGRKKGVV